MRYSLAFLLFVGATHSLSAQENGDAAPLEVYGRITDGENKLDKCQIIVYKENERVGELTTDKSGKFDVALAINETYSLELRKEGFAAKRIVIDTHMPPLKEDVELTIAPIGMDISLLEKSKYDGANTDDLDFPFAIVKWSKGQAAFVQDQEYTIGMQRTNGAILLMAARTEMKR
ncbi:MAG: hypothetical protein IPN38_03770 [Flavobacteriales bacterium]|nr:hypothetical protein [Flavobacteriales bacterium]MBL0035299.1 hypothetical protein [Flavobacteriales bacterium]